MKIPIVAIVGRPNVGKSTLFNRLVGKTEAIIDDVSGVTRDRNYGDVEWNGKLFKLIDTGGYIPNSLQVFDAAVREQIQIAVNQADVILFLVDVRDGITPIDSEIADIMRTSDKKIVLVVNKVDSSKYEQNVPEFFQFGLGEPVDIAASAGRKIGDLLDIITEDFPDYSELDTENELLKIAIVGKPNVGKSSLANSLLGQQRSIVTNIPGTTRDSVDSILKYYGREILLIDTAGLRKRTKVKENIEFYSTVRTLKTIAESDVTIVMIDAQLGIEKQDLKILDEAVRRRKGVIISVNKWDLIEKNEKATDKYEIEIRKKIRGVDYIPVIFISALTKQRIFKLIELCEAIYSERKKKIPTNELNDVLLTKIINHPPPAAPNGKEIKIKYITQVGVNYPVFIFFTNYPKYIAEAYKRFLEKLIRGSFGFAGVPFTLSFRKK